MKKKSCLYFIFLCFMMIQCSTGQTPGSFQKKLFMGSAGDTLPYRIFIPPKAPAGKVPLVIFLHGSGERGKDNEKQLRNGVMQFIADRNQKKYPCYVVVPQCPEGKRWVETDFRLPYSRQPEKISLPLRLVKQLTDSLVEFLPVDPSRIYITGLSMGGFGTWDLITRFPDYYAAAVPVCGGGDDSLAFKLTAVPVWAFHGLLDDVVMPSRTENMVNGIRKSGGTPRCTLYPDLGHACWEETYADPELFQWLFSRKKEQP